MEEERCRNDSQRLVIKASRSENHVSILLFTSYSLRISIAITLEYFVGRLDFNLLNLAGLDIKDKALNTALQLLSNERVGIDPFEFLSDAILDSVSCSS